MPSATITSTASTFGTISGTFVDSDSTISGTISGVITGTLDGSVGVPGVGVPDGGTAGQVLAKVDGVDYNTEWVTPTGGAWGTITGTLSNQTDLQTALNLKAPLASPALTGVPTSPTAATLTSTTQIATTAFVQQELAAGTAVAKNLEVYVRNQSGSTIPAGSIVYISGATGNRPLITLAQANNDANSAQTIGFVKESIANNGFGYVMVRGELENIDTSALTEGVQLYLSPTTAGAWTTTKPYAPSHLVYVGIVIRSHPTLGVILVAVQNGYELDELHDVAAQTPSDLDLLSYESSTSLWKNKSFSTLGLLTSASAASTYYPLTGNPSGFLTSASLSGYATESWVTTQLGSYLTTSSAASTYAPIASPTFTGTVTIPSGASISGYLTSATAASTYQTLAGMSSYAPLASPALTGNVTITTNSTSPALIIVQSGTGDVVQFKDATSDTTYSFIDQNGKVGTVASTTTSAGFNIPHGTAPSAPVNGDIWSTTGDLLVRLNGSTRTMVNVEGTQTISGTKTFSASSITLGNSTAAGTIALGTGATASGSTKTVNIGTAGAAGSTTNIAIGSTTGTSTTTLQGITNGVTQSAGDSSLKLATTAFVTTADNLKANLASPALTGTPTAPTAANGTNTTQIATTAFVLANGGSTSFATTAEVVAGTSTTTALAPANVGFLVANPRLQSLAFINLVTVSGSGAATASNVQNFSRQAYLSSLATGRASFSFGTINAATAGFGTSTAKADQVDFSKKVWLSGYACMGWTGGTSYIGDANTMCRITLGGYSSATTGDMTLKGIGLKKVGGSSSFVNLTVHNGTTRTDVASTVTVPDGGGIHWQIYSDGTGNVTLYINGTQAATTTAGPTTATASGQACYREQVEAVSTPGVRQAMNCNGGWFYTE